MNADDFELVCSPDVERESMKFNTILVTRLALCHAAMGSSPTLTEFMLSIAKHGLSVVQDLSRFAVNGYPEPLEVNWAMYQFDPADPCPISRISMAPWLAQGIATISDDHNYPLEAIDPAAIVARARDVVNKAVIPKMLHSVFEIVDALEAGAAKFKTEHPEVEDEMRKSLRIKGMAVDDHMATGTHQEYSHYAALSAS